MAGTTKIAGNADLPCRQYKLIHQMLQQLVGTDDNPPK